MPEIKAYRTKSHQIWPDQSARQLSAVSRISKEKPNRSADPRRSFRGQDTAGGHVSFLDGLSEVLDRDHGSQSILLGDFNQRIPRRGQPVHVFETLEVVLGKGFSVQTEGLIQPSNELSIDHCPIRPAPRSVEVTAIRKIQSGIELSDHFGMSIEITLTPGEIPAV